MSEEDDPRDTKVRPERFRFAEIARNTPESQIRAGDPVTTFVPHFSLGEKSRFEDHYSSLFYALKRKTHQYQFQLAREFWKKGGQQFVSRDVGVLFGDSLVLMEMG